MSGPTFTQKAKGGRRSVPLCRTTRTHIFQSLLLACVETRGSNLTSTECSARCLAKCRPVRWWNANATRYLLQERTMKNAEVQNGMQRLVRFNCSCLPRARPPALERPLSLQFDLTNCIRQRTMLSARLDTCKDLVTHDGSPLQNPRSRYESRTPTRP